MKPISTRNLAALPPPGKLHPLCRALAMLDAILFPDDWDNRYYSFTAKWGPKQSVFQMRDGSGDFYFAWFPEGGGAAIRGFGHESAMSPWSTQRTKTKDAGKPWPGLFEGLPKKFAIVRTEPAFGEDEVTFCTWWSRDHEMAWRLASDLEFPKLPKGKDPDGSEWLFQTLDGDPRTYAKHAKVYAERNVPLDVITKFYALEPLTDAMITSVNPDADLATVRKEAKEMGYPLAPVVKAKKKR